MARERTVLPQWFHEVALGIGLFLAGLAINSMNNIGAKLEDVRVLLAQAAQQVNDHEGRITRIETFLNALTGK